MKKLNQQQIPLILDALSVYMTELQNTLKVVSIPTVRDIIGDKIEQSRHIKEMLMSTDKKKDVIVKIEAPTHSTTNNRYHEVI